MTPGEGVRCSPDVKAAPFSDSRSLITYKRRKRDGGDSGRTRSGESDAELITRPKHGNYFPDNGATVPGTVSRASKNWRSLLEALLRVEGVGDDSGATSCIRKALLRDPFGCSNLLNHGPVQTEDSLRANVEIKYNSERHSMRQPLRFFGINSENGLGRATNLEDEYGVDTLNCRNALCDILGSDKFALLCDLLCENFKNKPFSDTLDLNSVFSKMKKGFYEQSTDMFDKDMQLMWGKFLRIGEEMTLLASSLLSISQASYLRQVGETPASNPIIDDRNLALNEIFNSVQLGSGCVTNLQMQSTKESVRDANNVESFTTAFTSQESDPSPKAEAADPLCVQKISTCYCCGLEADGNKCLICDGCEAVHHVSCIKPPVEGIPDRIWYCAACSARRGKTDLPTMSCGEQNHPHLNCVVCKRLSNSGSGRKTGNRPEKIPVPSSSRECSVSSMDDDESSEEPSRTALMHLCKQCGTCEDEDKRFIVCSNKHCLYKYYHICCLRSKQLASKFQPSDRWYCPSCLCRSCLVDKDDDLICLCDACDEGYHIYCMKPPRTTVPKGAWYCLACNVEKAKKGMKMYEQWVLQNHGKNGVKVGKQLSDQNTGSEATPVAGNKRNRILGFPLVERFLGNPFLLHGAQVDIAQEA